MGAHAFKTEPEHCAIYRSFLGDGVPPIYGLDERWNMPGARHRRAIAKDTVFEGVDHYVLTYHVGGATARRSDPAASGIAMTGAVSLQSPQSPATVSSDGVVEYAHLYFKQSLLCEVFDELAQDGVAEPSDFFGLLDTPLAQDIEAYLQRAADRDDPATALEMDNRAYLIALGILRVAEKSGMVIALRNNLVERTDLKRVLRTIDEQMAEPLRLTDLASLVDMSPFHFARVFRDHVGEPPAQYVQRRRTERAIDLIRETGLPLSEIAYRTGFSSQSHMTRRVKETTGQTPRQVRTGDSPVNGRPAS